MRRTLACWTLLLCCTHVSAAGRTQEAKPLGPPLSREEAQVFALQLKTTLDLMVKQYARPVPRPELVAAALKGLYEAAAAPVPPYLLAEAKRADAADNKVIELITRTRQRLGNPAVLQGAKALEVSLWAALRSLDPYSFLTYEGPTLPSRGSTEEGVGLELEPAVGVGPLRVKAVVPGGPAQRAGIAPGDQITHLNGQPLDGKPAAETEALWRRLTQAGRNQSFEVAVLRQGRKKARKVTLEPGTFKVETVFGVSRNKDNSWDFWLDPREKIAHIRLGALRDGTANELERVLDGLHKAGLEGLVLDLRWCPGGMLNEAVGVAGLFVGDRPIATIDYRDGHKQTCTRRQHGFNAQGDSPTFLDLPLVVLVNGETLGGGELVAAAVQDAKRGAVVGQRTVGKGSVQNSLVVEHGGAYHPVPNLTVRLSIGLFTRASGKNLQRFANSKPTDDWGVRPDTGLEFAVSRQLSERLRELWLLHSLRPGRSDEATPMDDPANDAQRQFAVKVLRKMIKKEKAAH